MKKYILILFVWLLKVYPIVHNLILIFLYYISISYGKDLGNYTYTITGASIFSISICFLSSYIFKFCTWYRIICLSSFVSLVAEWVDVNVVSIPHYAIFIQCVLVTGLLISLAVYNYDRKSKNKNNRSLKKAN